MKQIVKSPFLKLLLAALLLTALLPAQKTQAVGETSTKFGMFVPPNGNNTGRDPMLVVTAVQDNTSVDIVDDNADGDNDDSALGLTLNTGQSHIIFIQDGAVNDDLGGKQDGDYFQITSSKPVIVANLTANTDWQHDFLPADNRRMSGTSFYLYRPIGFTNTNGRNQLLNLFAYSNNTDIQIIDITDVAKTNGGTTSVVSDADGTVIFSATLDAGEDLQEVNGYNVALPAGRTFHIISNKDITAMFGSLSKGQTGSRDGGAYVPGKNGTSADRTFYFAIPYRYANEREMRLVSYAKAANVTIRGWNTNTDQWNTITTVTLPKYGHEELIGNELGTSFNYYLFEVTADETISIFETNWLETGSFGTSDIMTFISASDGQGAGKEFLAYMGPPALELGVQLSHLYVYSYQATSGIAYDADSYGEYIELYNNSGQTLNLAGWSLANEDGWRVTIPAGKSVAAGQTFLLEFHQEATNATADFVYGTLFPKFKLGNGSDTITLYNAAGTAVDTLTYTDTGWGNHGVYTALERKNPNLAFTATNAQNSATFVANNSTNLGSYYGTPDVHNGVAGNGSGTLVINELMTGRIYQSFSIDADSYHDIALTVDEWLGLHSGDNPATGDMLENPYLIVETDQPVSVMNANWNDNWLAYGTGTLQPDPLINHTANYYERIAGEPIVFSTYVSNEFNTLYNPITTIQLPVGVDYTPGSYTSPSQISGVTPTEVQNGDGSWTLTWTHDKPLPGADVYFFQVAGTISSSLSAGTLLQSTAHTSGQDTVGSAYASQDSAVVNVGTIDESTVINDIIINEVMTDATCGAETIEIHNRSTSAINIGGWELADEDGFIFRFPNLTFIPNDGYLLVSLSSGVNDELHFYTGDAYAGALGDSEDQMALYSSSTHDVTTLVDFVQWATGSLQDGADDDLAVAAGLWQDGTFVTATAKDQTIGRDRSATDSNGRLDWDNTGGADSAVPTLGAINVSIPGEDVTPPPQITVMSATAVPGQEGSVRIDWTNPAVGDLAGVRILRANNGLPDSLGDGELVYDGIAGTYTDTGLTPGDPVFYTLFAYDDAGNVSCPHADAPTKAVPPQDVYIAFEDLKGWSWVDWDMNDLIVYQSTAVQVNEIGVTQIDVVMKPVARGGLFDHTLHLAVDFHGTASVTKRTYNSSGVLQSTTTSYTSDGTDVTVIDSTLAALPPNAQDGTTNAVSGSGQTDGPRIEISIALSDPAANPLETLQALPFDPWIRVANTGVHVHLVGAGEVGNTQTVSGGLLHGRDLPFGIVLEDAWEWPEEDIPIWEAYPDYVNYIISGGTTNTDWMSSPQTALIWEANGTPGRPWYATTSNSFLSKFAAPMVGTAVFDSPVASQTGWPKTTGGYIFSSPVIVDLDGDNQNELIVAANNFELYVFEADGSATPGWSKNLLSYVRSSPAVGDIDGDGDLELVIGTDNGKLHAYHHDGTAVTNFPLSLNSGAIKASPTLAQLDGDAALEIIVHTANGKVDIRNGNGSAFSANWPQTVGTAADSFGNLIVAASPAVGDMDGDNQPEIVVASTDGNVYAWHLDGTVVSVLWPRQTDDWIYATPIIVDLNEDGYRDVVALSGDGKIYAWRGEGTPLPGFPIDARSPFVASPAIADVDGDGDLELFAVTLDGKVLGYHHDGTPMFNWPRQTGATTYASPIIGDVDGDGDVEIIVGSHNGRINGWHHDGIPIVDWPLQTADWIVGTPTLGDLDKDGDIEIAVGAYDRKVYVWDEAGSYNPANIPWGGFAGDSNHASLVQTDTPIQALPDVVFTIYLPMTVKP
ncbi:MAG: lamin tail domain-containing protein [Ardenticatenaceae bacterium]|nr:lamin tail domain-containing protein [Anaerolineales bacterium]MCB8937806.1 lamin tail domain-containing protein [Ardenticatenaceae bacterium]MCB8974375.1 lamin tail domain-containing protein [Ardenticatenaceae bacterium]